MSTPPALLEAATSHLVIVDVQDKLAPAVAGREGIEAALLLLLEAARVHGVPVTVTEQYPKGLGPTTDAVAKALPDGAAIIEKLAFSAMREPNFTARIEGVDRPRLIVAGMETHVCVLQTVLDALRAGLACCVVADAVGSRTDEDRRRGLDRMAAAGAEIITAEMAVFEWTEKAGTPAFRQLAPRIRDRAVRP